MTAAPKLDRRELTKDAKRFQKIFTSPPLFRAALVAKVPLLLFTGARVDELDLEHCQIHLPFGWINKNPFGSMYFASIMMCSEAVTGGLVMLHDENRDNDFVTIVKSISGDFDRAAYSDMTFVCDEGDKVDGLFERALDATDRVEETLLVEGIDDDGEHCSTAEVTWSIRVK